MYTGEGAPWREVVVGSNEVGSFDCDRKSVYRRSTPDERLSISRGGLMMWEVRRGQESASVGG